MGEKLITVRQRMSDKKIDNITLEVKNQIKKLDLNYDDLKGKKIGITAGSRGINAIDEVICSVVSIIKELGGFPVIVAAMGSHGGATEKGQQETLTSLGITEDSVKAPIIFCASAVQIGETIHGIPVYCNTEATKLDGLVIVNRVKSHTDFSGDIESGICKMMTIGLGNNKGASNAHYYAIDNGYPEIIRESAEVFLGNLPIIFAVGIVESWKNSTMKIEAMATQEIICKERQLLKYYKENSIKLPFKNINILIVGEMGKNISGTGMDTKVIGRIKILGQQEPLSPEIDNIVVLSLTEESHGNATGIGLADYTTVDVFNNIDINATTINGLTSMAPGQIRMPCILNNGKEAIDWAIKTLGPAKADNISMAYIKNTSSLEYLAVTENILNQIAGRVDVISEPEELSFDSKGCLISPII